MELAGDSSETKMKKNGKGGIDRISNLPETVLHHILAFLDMKHVVQTCFLSRRWRYVWTSLPDLNFDRTLFYSVTTGWVEGFKELVDNELILRESSSNIQSFRLISSDFSQCDAYIYKWILATLKRKVERLYLDINLDIPLRLPNCLFTCKSLTILRLKNQSFPLKLNLPDSMSLPVLKTLSLCYVVLGGDDDVLNKIFLCCPVLESLSLKCACCNNSINLYAPNLVSFSCKDLLSTDYFIDNLSALVKADIDLDIDKFDVVEEGGVQTLEMRQLIVRRTLEFLQAIRNVEY